MSIAFSVLTLTALASHPASAAVIATVATGANNAFSVSSTDAADASQGGTVSFTGTQNFDSNAPAVINGATYSGVYGSAAVNNTANSLTPSVGDTLILNLAPSPYGWDIGSIVGLTGVGSAQIAGRSDHSYTIALSTDGVTFDAPIINVNSSTTAAEGQITVLDDGGALLGTGIRAVRFRFGNAVGLPENMYREFDVFATATVPEPTSLLLLGFSGCALLVRRRR